MSVTGAEIALGKEIFSRLWAALTKSQKSKALERQKSAAWRELLKGDAGDDAIIESALAAARAAGDTSADHMRLESMFAQAVAVKRGGKTASKSRPKSKGRKAKTAPKKKRRGKKKAAKRK